jgi:hypothetical protein
MEDLEAVLRTDVLKRDVFDSEEAKQASEFLKKAARSAERAKVRAAADAKPVEAVAAVKVVDSGQQAA